MSHKVEKIYNELLDICKSEGLRVVHCKIAQDTSGEYMMDKKNIRIDRRGKYTMEGLKTLSHEFFHYRDHRRGRYKRFYNKQIHKDIGDMSLVIKAELSVSMQARDFLKKRGIYAHFEDLTRRGLKENIDFWLKHYFE